MCRVLSYLGEPILIEDLLYKPDNSFIKQSYHPKYMSHLLNLAGFGLVVWEASSYNHKLPYIYKTHELPFYDENLRNLSSKITPYCFLTHIRGVAYNERRIVSNQNVHPFIFAETNIALAHNGALFEFEKMKYDLLQYIHPKYQIQIHGTTDSEWIYALFISQLPNTDKNLESEDIINAIIETLTIIKKIRAKHNIAINSPVNIFVSNGEFIAATRYVFNFGWQPLDAPVSTHFTYHSLWYTYGEGYGFFDNEFKMKVGEEKSSIIIASEPLTEDTTTWIEVPEYTLMIATLVDKKVKIISRDINL
jgi:glutamine amidotransferase